MTKEVIEGLRLSPQQKHLWCLQPHDEALPYRTQVAVRIDGSLDVVGLMTAVEQVVHRHEILRTTFCCLPGMTIPLQVITESNPALVTLHDLEGWNADQQETQIENLFNEMQRASFDLKCGPLMHASLIRVSADQNILIISLPAMNEDAAGLRNLVKEISRHYLALLSGEAAASHPIQYADSSEWNNDLLEAPDRDEGRAYWREQDFSACQLLELPFKTHCAEDTKFTPEFITTKLDVKPAAIDRLAEKHNIPPSLVLLACWQVLVWRLTLQPQIIVGCATDGREHEELKTALGLFERYLPARSHLHEDLRFVELVKQLGRTTREGREYQEYFTWEENSGREAVREAGYFPICFEYVERAESYAAGEVSFTVVREYACTERYEVKLSCVRGTEELRAELHYDAGCYREADMRRMEAEYQRLLQSVVENEQARISELEIVSEDEREQLLVKWNETEVAYEDEVSIQELFERQAAGRPEAVAVVCGPEQLSYGELNRRANQLGHYLQRRGVGPEVRVGLCVERSVEMVVGVLGILKAGGAYVPLDPSYPEARLGMMITDSGAEVLLTQAHLVEQIPLHEAQVICLDEQWEEIKVESAENPVVEVAAENLAYVIYTSGSTGRPKGVGVTQRNLVHTTRAREVYYQSRPGSFLLLSSITFDSSVAGVFWTLCGGGRLVVPGEGMQREARVLVQVVSEQEVTHLLSLPSLYRLLLEEGNQGELAKLQAVIVAGEVCPPGLVQRHQEVVRSAALYNEYGPTEGSVWSTVQQCEQEGTEGVVPIGRPIANVRVYLLEEGMRVAPLGVRGELYVGGAGVSRGYLNDPALTAAKYVPDPFSGELGGRLYRTGDVGRYQPGGELEFLGRLDGQVKIRGYRIEVGEIEAVLGTHAGVAGAVLVARAGAGGDQQLVGYVVRKEAAGEVSGAELRQWLGERLPDYMVPSLMVVLEEWPLMPNGKVDRQRLPAPEQVMSEGQRKPARTPVEEVVQSIWEEVLGVSDLSVTANFFELGGHSLLATQVMSRLREAVQVELPVRSLFANPTVRGLAAEVAEQMQAAQGLSLPPIRPGWREGELPLSYAQQRLWFADQLTPGSALYNVAAAVRLSGALNVGALERTLAEIIRRHEVLRTSFPARQGKPVQVIAPASDFILAVTDLTHLAVSERETEAHRLILEGAQEPFDLSRGPLLRASLLRLGEAEHIVLLTMHHIVSDGWSKGVLIREVASLYESYSAGMESPLAELVLQYADYALWQREWLTGEVLGRQLEYWQEQLAGAPETLALPTDKSRPAVQSFSGGQQRFSLSPELSQQLKELSRQESSSLFMTLLAAFQALLHYYSGQTDIVVGANVANRHHGETEELIGFFVNTLALRCDLSGDPSLRQLLKRVREVCLEAYARQDVPFEKLVAALQLDRNLSRSPLFQVKIDLDTDPMDRLELPGLNLSSVEILEDVGRYDLHLLFTEASGVLLGRMVYDKNIFDSVTMDRMSSQFQVLLHRITEQPDIRLSELNELLAEGDRQYQVAREIDYQQSIHQKFKQIKQRATVGVS